MAGQGTREAMADRGAWVAMVDPGTQEAMAERGARAAMVDPGTQEAMAERGANNFHLRWQTLQGRDQTQEEELIH